MRFSTFYAVHVVVFQMSASIERSANNKREDLQTIPLIDRVIFNSDYVRTVKILGKPCGKTLVHDRENGI